MSPAELAFAGLRAPLRQLRATAIAACAQKGCWLKDLRGVSVDELREQMDAIAEMMGAQHG